MKLTIPTLLVSAAFLASFTFIHSAQPADDSVISSPETYLNGQVVAIRHLTLKKGVDANAADRFVATRWNPAWRNYMPGARQFIAKGERGQKVGEYISLFVIDSKRSRDFYWPSDSTSTPAVNAAWIAADTTLLNSVNAELDEYFEPGWGIAFTDYVELAR